MSRGTESSDVAPAPQVVLDVLTQIARQVAGEILAMALKDEVAAYLAATAEGCRWDT